VHRGSHLLRKDLLPRPRQGRREGVPAPRRCHGQDGAGGPGQVRHARERKPRPDPPLPARADAPHHVLRRRGEGLQRGRKERVSGGRAHGQEASGQGGQARSRTGEGREEGPGGKEVTPLRLLYLASNCEVPRWELRWRAAAAVTFTLTTEDVMGARADILA